MIICFSELIADEGHKHKILLESVNSVFGPCLTSQLSLPSQDVKIFLRITLFVRVSKIIALPTFLHTVALSQLSNLVFDNCISAVGLIF